MRSMALRTLGVFLAFSFLAPASLAQQAETRAEKETKLRAARVETQRIFEHGGLLSEIARSAPRIINGDKLDQTAEGWAWTVSLTYDDIHSCGGAFVSPNIRNGIVLDWNSDDDNPTWVMTAAHCVTDRDGNLEDAQRFRVVSGHVSLLSGMTVSQTVKAIHVHDGYDPVTLENDVALLELDEPAHVPDVAERTSIRLPDGIDAIWLYRSHAALSVTGWGTTEDSPMSTTLERVMVPYVDRYDCQAAYEFYNTSIENGTICAGFSSGGYDSCQGDSGGPLFFRPARAFGDPINEPVLVGVVSWGIGCALSGLYGVYTNVLAIRSWAEYIVTD